MLQDGSDEVGLRTWPWSHDVQWSTPHLARLGVIDVDRAEYLALLSDALERPSPQWTSLDDPAWNGGHLLERLRK